jgi:GTP-binding protein
MKVNSAEFIKGAVGDDEVFYNGIPQIAFIGRSNVGKSSLINSFTGVKGLAKTSSFPGRTREINIFLINNKFYLVDLPGYGFTKTSRGTREKLESMIIKYFFESPFTQFKVVLVVDSIVGMTGADIDMLNDLRDSGKSVIVVATKTDKLKNSEFRSKISKIEETAKGTVVIPYSSEKKVGLKELETAIFETN